MLRGSLKNWEWPGDEATQVVCQTRNNTKICIVPGQTTRMFTYNYKYVRTCTYIRTYGLGQCTVERDVQCYDVRFNFVTFGLPYANGNGTGVQRPLYVNATGIFFYRYCILLELIIVFLCLYYSRTTSYFMV